MRSDYALYGVAIILFVITAIFLAYTIEFRELIVTTTAVFGLLFIGLGYTQRPRPSATEIKAPPPPPSTPATTEVVQETKPPEPVVESTPPKLELTAVKGIKEKRAAQLKTLGINTVEDLAKASANNLAAGLKISPKITGKWIETAKSLLEKS